MQFGSQHMQTNGSHISPFNIHKLINKDSQQNCSTVDHQKGGKQATFREMSEIDLPKEALLGKNGDL